MQNLKESCSKEKTQFAEPSDAAFSLFWSLRAVELLNFLCIWIFNGAHFETTLEALRKLNPRDKHVYFLIEKSWWVLAEHHKVIFQLQFFSLEDQGNRGETSFWRKLSKSKVAKVVNFSIAKYLNWVCHDKSGSFKNRSHFRRENWLQSLFLNKS